MLNSMTLVEIIQITKNQSKRLGDFQKDFGALHPNLIKSTFKSGQEI